MMEAVRSLGLAARFVTGYVYVPDRDRGEVRGGGSTHAWCQVYLPGAGWVEFDPTNGIVGSRDLIRVGVARDPAQAVPLSGSYVGAADDFGDMAVEVIVRAGLLGGARAGNRRVGLAFSGGCPTRMEPSSMESVQDTTWSTTALSRRR